MNRLLNNWNLKLTALVLAVALWTHVRGAVNPIETANFTVRLDAIAPKGLLLMNGDKLPRMVTVTLKAPHLTIRELKGMVPSDPLAPADDAPELSNAYLHGYLDFSEKPDLGKSEVPIKVDTSVEQAEVIGFKPTVADVELDQATTRAFPVRAVLGTDVQDGVTLESIVVRPESTLVTGPSQALDRIRGVHAEVDLEPGRIGSATKQTVELDPVDERGRRVEDLTLEPDQVSVTAEVREKQITREVAVVAGVRGVAGPGFVVDKVEVDPEKVRVRGSKSDLENLDLIDVPLDVTGMHASAQRQIALVAPPGVEVLGQASVSVRVKVSPLHTPELDLPWPATASPTPAVTPAAY